MEHEFTFYIYSGEKGMMTFHLHTVHSIDGVRSWLEYFRAGEWPNAYAVDAKDEKRLPL